MVTASKATILGVGCASLSLMRPNDKQWWSNDELADLFGVPLLTVRKWRAEGTGPKGVRLGRHVRYSRAAIDEWVEQRSRAQVR